MMEQMSLAHPEGPGAEAAACFVQLKLLFQWKTVLLRTCVLQQVLSPAPGH